MKRGQASLEYIVLIGAILVLLVPLFYFAINKSSENIKLNQAEQVVTSLAKAADEVYALGPGSKKNVWITVPGAVKDISVGDSEVSLTLGISNGTSDIVGFTKAPVVGNIPLNKGTYYVSVELLDSGIVQIGEGNDTSIPNVVWTSPEHLACNPITLRANTNEPATCKFDTIDLNYDLMDTTMVGSSIGHSYTMDVQMENDYLYYVRCRDAANNTMDTSAIINYTVNFTYCQGMTIIEYDPPEVTLISPVNEYISNLTQVDFEYRATDMSMLFLCRLIANDTIITTIYEPEKDVVNTISGSLDRGNYDWQVNCTDAHGNEGESVTRAIEIDAILDIGAPIVNLVSPDNDSLRNFNFIKFFYNVTDLTSGIHSCKLTVTGDLDLGGTATQTVIDTSIFEGQSESISLNLEKGNHTWNISCKDDSIYLNEGYSESRFLRVNATTEETFVTSCPGVCGYYGFSNGVCRQSDEKCRSAGEEYIAEGDVFCTGGAQSDTCCCVP